MGHIRGHGCRELLVCCGSGQWHHRARLNGDWLADDVPVRSLCRRKAAFTKKSPAGTRGVTE
jgi:hypothetical protein